MPLIVELEEKYDYTPEGVKFKNNIRISRKQLDALYGIKGQSTCVPSFLWMQLLELSSEVEQERPGDTLVIRFNRRNFKRIERYMEYLVLSKFFRMETEKLAEDTRKNLEVRLYDIHPAILSILPMI